MKVCYISSTGGHFEQLIMLKPLMEQYESYIITEKTEYSTDVGGIEFYYIDQINRKKITFLFDIIKNFLKSLFIFLKEKPTIIISTGALATVPTCIIAKLFGKKIIFIESFAKVNSPTLTGRLMYKIANQFYVQWEDMLTIYPKAIYKGGIY